MKNLKLLAALLALAIGLAGCGKGSSASSSKPEKMLDGDNMIASPSAKQEYTEPEDVTYMRLLAGEDEYRACVLYLGGSYEITTDVQKVLDSQQGLRELWGFVYDIPQDHWVVAPDGGCDLYCIFPQEAQATLFVYETSLTDDAEKPLQRGKQLYYYAAARSGTAAQTAGGKAASNGASAARSGVEQTVEKGKTAVSTAVKGLMNAAKGNAHVLVIVGVFLLLILMVMSGFSSCGILFSGGTQVSGQTMYSAEDRDIRGAEQDYKKLEKELDKKIKRIPTDHPGYNEYQYHLDPIEHDPWQLTSFLATLYDDYTRSEVQGKLKETFKKQYKLTTWVEVQIRYKTVWVISPAGIPVPTQVPYEYRIFHTKLVNRGLEVVIREELNADQWKRYEIFQDTLGGRPYLFNGGLPPGGSDGSGTPGIDYQVPAEALTDSEFAAIYKEAQKYVGTPYVWGGSTPETGFDCSGYVCWVYNQNGYDVGRTTANGLWNKSQHISEAEAKPGDLVFFKGTYDTPGMSHTGIYLGNGMMVSAGDPIKYANIHSSYWEKHLAGFGRLSK